MNGHFIEEDIPMTKKHIKRSSLVIREKEIKPQQDIITFLKEELKFLKAIAHSGKNAEKWGHIYITGENAK